jgi:ribosomal-protein-alanine N-acetyltransferase
MTFRDYRPADFQRICEIDRRCFAPPLAYTAEELRAGLRDPGAVAMVAENAAGQVVAFILAQRLRLGRGHIITLDVLPSYRRRGVARELMKRCEERLRAAGVRQVRLETAVSNQPAQSLYRSLGYTLIRRVPRYYASGEDALILEKNVPESGCGGNERAG